MDCYLAIDIGASSGRHILGYLENGRMIYNEIHRFANGMKTAGGELCWDLDMLFNEVIFGIKHCAQLDMIPRSVGIDTWGVDFVLLDGNGDALGSAVAYRDSRTEGMDAEVYKYISEEDLYRRTGIQKQIFNTIYQLMALKLDPRQLLKRAKHLLMIPEYLNFRLCGEMKAEYTNASTTGLINASAKTWDDEIISSCGFPREIFKDIAQPGTVLGSFTPDIQKLVGFDSKVVLPGTHDTASAIMAVPVAGDNAIYISSGTWSLMGVEKLSPDCSEESRARNFTNEGGYNYRYRFLKNIMGLWMIQSVKKELNNSLSFQELCDMAEKEDIKSIVDCYSGRFLSPENMTDEIRMACRGSGQQVPDGPGELAAVVYNSLAVCYRETVKELEELTGRTYNAVHVLGGGSKDSYLNRKTAEYTGKTVIAGPVEATAMGNLMAQMIAQGVFKDLTEGRECIKRSSEFMVYEHA